MTDEISWYDSKEYHDIVESLSSDQVLMCRICDPSRRITKVATGGFVHWPAPTKEPSHYAQPYIPMPESWGTSNEKANLMTEAATPESQMNGYHYCVSCGDVVRAVEMDNWYHMAVNPKTGRWEKTSHHVHNVSPSSKRYPTMAYSWDVGRKSGLKLDWTTSEPKDAVSEERRDYGNSDAPMTKEEYENLKHYSNEDAESRAESVSNGEVRMTDPDTGAQKGSKEARFDLIPVGPLTELAELYGFGAKKYAARNWERGYDLSLSYAALQRHANLWWAGEDTDSETLKSHMASVAWHAFTLMQLLETHPEKDDRPSRMIEGNEVIFEEPPYAQKPSATKSEIEEAYLTDAIRDTPMTRDQAQEIGEALNSSKIHVKLKNAEAMQEYEDLELQEVFEVLSGLSRTGLNRVILEANKKVVEEGEVRDVHPSWWAARRDVYLDNVSSTYPAGCAQEAIQEANKKALENELNDPSLKIQKTDEDPVENPTVVNAYCGTMGGVKYVDPPFELTDEDIKVWEKANPGYVFHKEPKKPFSEEEIEEGAGLPISELMEIGLAMRRMNRKQLEDVSTAVSNKLFLQRD